MNAATVGSVLSLAATLGVAWLLTYAVHSTALIGTVWLAERGGLLRSLRLRDVAWRTALLGGVLTATLQLAAGLTPFGGAAELQAPALPAILTSPDAPEAAAAASETDPALAVVVRTVHTPPVVRIHTSDGPRAASPGTPGTFPRRPPLLPSRPFPRSRPRRRSRSLPSPRSHPPRRRSPSRRTSRSRDCRPRAWRFLGWAVVASAFLLRLAVLRARLLTTLGERAPVVDPMVRARLEGLCQRRGARPSGAAHHRRGAAQPGGPRLVRDLPPRRGAARARRRPAAQRARPRARPPSPPRPGVAGDRGRCWSSSSSSSR